MKAKLWWGGVTVGQMCWMVNCIQPATGNMKEIMWVVLIPNGKLNRNIISPGMMITATPGALQHSAEDTEHVAG